VREAGKDLGPSAVAVIGHGERKTSPVQTRRFRRRLEPVSLINLPNSATNPSQAAPKPDKVPTWPPFYNLNYCPIFIFIICL
jgi:hypothetical protein